MESPVVFFLILTAIIFADHGEGQRIYAADNPTAVGSNLTIFSESVVTLGAWTFNGHIIVLIYPGGYEIETPWIDRSTYNVNTSTLTITSTSLEDAGLYKLQQMKSFVVQLELSVQVPISNVTLSAKSTNLVEFNDTAVFTCSAANGSSLSYQWLDGNSTLSGGGGVQLSNSNSTLTIVSVTRFNQGPYRCKVSNGLGSKVSPPVNLNISYGPDSTTMTAMPMKSMYRSGSNITLSCSAKSSPPAMVRWMFNEMYLNQYGPQLNLQNVKENNSGNYRCVFYNSVTLRFNSISTSIQILDPVTPVVTSINGVPAILNEPFTLTCDVTGSFDSIQWWKDGQLLSSNSATVFDTNNKTLTLSSVQLSDGGDYQCQAFNPVSDVTSSPYRVEVNYGPHVTTIMGPNVTKAGDNVTFSCWADSVPSSLFKWYFNGFLVSNKSEYVTPPLTKEMSGAYICMAVNNITGKNNTNSIMLTVIDPIQNVQIEEPTSPAIEGHSFELKCNVTGIIDLIYWMKNGEPLLANNRTTFSVEKMMLMLTSVERSDAGDYQCMASNVFENKTSPSYRLLVNYGPEMPIVMGPNVVRMGDNATLSCHAKSTPPSLYKWYFNGSLVSNISEYVTPPLTKEMSGKYICMAVNKITGNNSTASIMLTVIVPIENIYIEPQMKPAIEGSSYELTCSVTGTVDYVYWMRNGKPLPADNRTVFHMEKKMVMLTSVEHSDTGDYQCMASNALENMTSTPYRLLVNYGPATPIIHGPAFGETESQVVFNCSAMSMPPSSITWWFNGSMVANTSEFTAGPLSLNMSGEYTCIAFNHVTGRNSTNSTTLKVIEAIKSVMTRSFTTPIDQKNFTLACHVVGPYDSIYWAKDNMYLKKNASSTNIYNFEDNMLHFTPLMMHNSGAYHCVATNKVAHYTSPRYTLLVNYGPLNVQITGPDSEKQGVNVSLTCAAESQPESNFHWFLNNQSMPLGNGSVITFLATKKNEGKYICEAKNHLTNITMFQSKTFAVAGHASATHFTTRSGLAFMGLCALSAHWLFL